MHLKIIYGATQELTPDSKGIEVYGCFFFLLLFTLRSAKLVQLSVVQQTALY